MCDERERSAKMAAEKAYYATSPSPSVGLGGMAGNAPLDSSTLQVRNLAFGAVIAGLWTGYRFKRRNWNGPNQYIQLQIPDSQSKMTTPYIYICTSQGDLVPWLASQTDMLAFDWEQVIPRGV